MTEKCVCCGAEIPEGRQVCPMCLRRTDHCRHRYSVYHKETDQPLILYGTSKACAKAMGIRLNSFYRYICRMRGGKVKLRKWAVYEDEVEELEDGK